MLNFFVLGILSSIGNFRGGSQQSLPGWSEQRLKFPAGDALDSAVQGVMILLRLPLICGDGWKVSFDFRHMHGRNTMIYSSVFY
jgi:hypothetical protein